ncbi:carbohydrate ABC transporter permease [Microbacterium sp. NPDC057407]|uniref:carbohydrate ABC transporter permease n=1 Tax=Microbacterium sp. NPDC057407 TaxID=3346120 RepID=UPI00366F4AF5
MASGSVPAVTRKRAKWSGTRLALNLFLIGASVLAVYPFLVMLFGSLKEPREISTNPGGPPLEPTLANYVELFTGESGAVMWRSILNSIIVSVPFTALTVLLCAMAGYAFTKYRFRGSNVLFAVLLASMLIPAEVNIPALYLFFSQIDWLNTYQVQIFPGTASVLGMFMARQYMSSMPTEVLEAARIDGAGHWRTFWSVAVPMSAPILGAIAVLTFVAKWSDYLWPKVMVGDPTFQPAMVVLPALSTGISGFIVHYEILLAGALVITIPILIVFLRFQDKLMNGTTAGAVRG